MGGRAYTITAKGEYSSGDLDEDAQGEALSLLIDAPVRLPDQPVSVGEEWTTEWTGDRQQKEHEGVFKYRQTAKLEEIVENGSRRAHITFEINGSMEIPPESNPQQEETLMTVIGSIVLDLDSGLIVANKSSGTITTELKSVGLKLVREIESNYEEK